jgi:hypothetical protein
MLFVPPACKAIVLELGALLGVVPVAFNFGLELSCVVANLTVLDNKVTVPVVEPPSKLLKF